MNAATLLDLASSGTVGAPPEPPAVAVGSHVVIEDLDDGVLEEYTLVGPEESSPADGRLSADSPVGRALAGRRAGEIVDAITPRRVRRLRIADVA